MKPWHLMKKTRIQPSLNQTNQKSFDFVVVKIKTNHPKSTHSNYPQIINLFAFVSVCSFAKFIYSFFAPCVVRVCVCVFKLFTQNFVIKYFHCRFKWITVNYCVCVLIALNQAKDGEVMKK